ncbi:MAG: glycosyltransferase [Planctomycetota bacterium]
MSARERLRVLHVAHSAAPEGRGGVEAYLAEILPHQRSREVDARMFTGSVAHWPEFGVEDLDVEGVPIRRIHRQDFYFDHFAKQFHPDAERTFRETLREWKPDVVHVHQWLRLSSELCAIAGEEGIPAVLTLHDLYSSCPRCFRVRPGEIHCERVLSVESCFDCVPRYGHESDREIRTSIELYRDHSRAEIESARTVLVASEATRDLISRGLQVDGSGFELLPLAYEPRFPTGVPSKGSDASRPLRFGYWGNLTYRKGIPVLIEAFAQLARTFSARPIELHLFGRIDTPELERQLQELAEGLPVTFHGRYEYEELAASGLDVAVFPMVCFETWGFVLDEAFELGLPVVLTDVGAMPERLGHAGLRVPPRDAHTLAGAMKRMAADDDLRARCREAIRGGDAERSAGSLPAHLDRLEAIYRRVIDEGPRAPRRLGAERWSELLWLQRESAQARSGGAPS